MTEYLTAEAAPDVLGERLNEFAADGWRLTALHWLERGRTHMWHLVLEREATASRPDGDGAVVRPADGC